MKNDIEKRPITYNSFLVLVTGSKQAGYKLKLFNQSLNVFISRQLKCQPICQRKIAAKAETYSSINDLPGLNNQDPLLKKVKSTILIWKKHLINCPKVAIIFKTSNKHQAIYIDDLIQGKDQCFQNLNDYLNH